MSLEVFRTDFLRTPIKEPPVWDHSDGKLGIVRVKANVNGHGTFRTKAAHPEISTTPVAELGPNWQQCRRQQYGSIVCGQSKTQSSPKANDGSCGLSLTWARTHTWVNTRRPTNTARGKNIRRFPG